MGPQVCSQRWDLPARCDSVTNTFSLSSLRCKLERCSSERKRVGAMRSAPRSCATIWCSCILKCPGQLPAYPSFSWGRRRDEVSEKRSEGAKQKGELLDVLNAFTWFSGFIKWEAAGRESKSDKSVLRTQQFYCKLAMIKDSPPWKISASGEKATKYPLLSDSIFRPSGLPWYLEISEVWLLPAEKWTSKLLYPHLWSFCTCLAWDYIACCSDRVNGVA